MRRWALIVLAILALISGVVLLAFGDTPVPVVVEQYQSYDLSEQIPFPIVERTAQTIRERDGVPAMVRFLTGHVQSRPADPNNSYYLSVVGNIYRERSAHALSRQYYRRALFGYPDVQVRSISSHRVAIRELLEIVETPDERVEYLRYLGDYYPDSIDRGLLAFSLGQAYEAGGRWEEAYESYRVFLSVPETVIPGAPDVRRDIARRLAFYDSNRRWTNRDLDDLVGEIKNALWSQDPTRLLRHRAGANFFAMSWEQEESDENSDIPTFDIGAFLRRSRVRFEDELELTSNANEAYLRTWGWSHRIPTWYLYFRRVDFPADPEIHGTWEWAGILFGESY